MTIPKEGFTRVDKLAGDLQFVRSTTAQLPLFEQSADVVSFNLPEGWDSPPTEAFPSCPLRFKDVVAEIHRTVRDKDIYVNPLDNRTFEFIIQPMAPTKRDQILSRAHDQISEANRAALSQSRLSQLPKTGLIARDNTHKEERVKTRQTRRTPQTNLESNQTLFERVVSPNVPYTLADAILEYSQIVTAPPRNRQESGSKPWKSQRRRNPNPQTKPKFVPRGTGRYSER